MNARKLAAVALAALLVSAGAAAAIPGTTPDEAQADDHAADSTSDHADDDRDENASANPTDTPATPAGENRSADATAQQGPSVELPSQVPDFVSTVHETIRDAEDGLGEMVSDLTPGDDERPDSQADRPADAA